MKNKAFTAALGMLGLITALFALTLSGCTDTPREPLRIASSPWPGYEPLYLARDLGYFAKERVRLFELPSADVTLEAFRNRSTDMASLTLDETLSLIDDGYRVRILLVMDVSNGGDAVLARPGIKALPDIKGKNIAIVNIPLGLYMLNRTLDKAGLKRSDVTVFSMPETQQTKFYRDGKADVVITYEPMKSELEKDGAHVLFDSSQIPNEIFDILVIHEDVYQQHRDDACYVARQWFKTLAYMQQHPQDAGQRIGKRLGVSVADYEQMARGITLPGRQDNKRILGGDKPELLGPAERLSDIMREEQQISAPVDTRSAIDPGFAACFD